MKRPTERARRVAFMLAGVDPDRFAPVLCQAGTDAEALAALAQAIVSQLITIREATNRLEALQQFRRELLIDAEISEADAEYARQQEKGRR